MADIYVDSTATGLNTGLNKTDAYTSLNNAGVDGAAAGDNVFVSNAHDEDNLAVDVILNFANGTPANPVKVICTDFSDDSLSSGARLSTGGGGGNYISVDGDVYIEGVRFEANQSFRIATTTESTVRGRNCIFTFDEDESSGTNGYTFGLTDPAGAGCEFEDCTFPYTISTLENVAPTFAGGKFRFRNCLWDFRGSSPPYGFRTSDRRSHLVMDDCRIWLADPSDPLIWQSNGEGYSRFSRCQINKPHSLTWADWITVNTNDEWDSNHELIDCFQPGGRPLPYRAISSRGLTTWVDHVYRSGGANLKNPDTPYSWEMTSSTHVIERLVGLESPETFTWISRADFPSAVRPALYELTLPRWQTTETGLTSDGASTWTGGSTLYKFDRTLGNGQTATIHISGPSGLNNDDVAVRWLEPTQIDGLLRASVIVYKPSTTIHVCPQIEVA